MLLYNEIDLSVIVFVKWSCLYRFYFLVFLRRCLYDRLPLAAAFYSADHKFVQNIDQHLLESITTSQKKSVFHEGFDSISGFLSVSKPYGLLTHCTNFCVSLYVDACRLSGSLPIQPPMRPDIVVVDPQARKYGRILLLEPPDHLLPVTDRRPVERLRLVVVHVAAVL